jgi:hypothetical protein
MLMETNDISDGALLQPNVIYIIPLMESLALPPDIYGIANPKSSTGRLDIFTRLLTEFGDEFERVRRGYSGGLYIEVVSQTFPILVRAGMKLNQLRFGRGRRAVVGEERLRQLGQSNFLIHSDEDTSHATVDRGLRLTVDLEGNGSGVVGYQAKNASSSPASSTFWLRSRGFASRRISHRRCSPTIFPRRNSECTMQDFSIPASAMARTEKSPVPERSSKCVPTKCRFFSKTINSSAA